LIYSTPYKLGGYHIVNYREINIIYESTFKYKYNGTMIVMVINIKGLNLVLRVRLIKK